MLLSRVDEPPYPTADMASPTGDRRFGSRGDISKSGEIAGMLVVGTLKLVPRTVSLKAGPTAVRDFLTGPSDGSKLVPVP